MWGARKSAYNDIVGTCKMQGIVIERAGIDHLMKLHIENIGKIRAAEIDVDGITVIAGENNTGKSTVGKALFCLFYALNNIQEKIREQKKEYVRREVVNAVIHHEQGKIKADLPSRMQFLQDGQSFFDKYVNEGEASSADRMYEEIKGHVGDAIADENLKSLAGRIVEYLNVPDEQVIVEIVNNTYDRAFNDQVNSRCAPEEPGRISAMIRGKEIVIEFAKDECTRVVRGVELTNKAICIDNPSITNNLDHYSYSIMGTLAEKYLTEQLRDNRKSKPEDDAVARVLNKNKLEAIYNVLNEAVGGTVAAPNGKLQYREKGAEYSINFSNLSYGIKSFLILKMLLERNILQRKDVLILDEPEIHLHPEWQVLFAHALVLLQREFELSLIITTHSHFFVDAVHLYTRLYETTKTTHYYITEEKGAAATLREVGGDLEDLYGSMSTAVDMLNSLRLELEESGR